MVYYSIGLSVVTSFVVLSSVNLSFAQSTKIIDDRPFEISGSGQLSTSRITELMDRTIIDAKQFHNEMTLQDFLVLIHKSAGKKGLDIGITVDLASFYTGAPEDDVMTHKVKLPSNLATVTFRTALEYALSNVSPNALAAYRIKKGHIVIMTTAKESKVLDYTLNSLALDCSLEESIEKVAEVCGVSIIIDQRVAEKAKANMKVKFSNKVRLGAVLKILTNMAELTFVLVDDVVYITTPANALEMKRLENK